MFLPRKSSHQSLLIACVAGALSMAASGCGTSDSPAAPTSVTPDNIIGLYAISTFQATTAENETIDLTTIGGSGSFRLNEDGTIAGIINIPVFEGHPEPFNGNITGTYDFDDGEDELTVTLDQTTFFEEMIYSGERAGIAILFTGTIELGGTSVLLRFRKDM